MRRIISVILLIICLSLIGGSAFSLTEVENRETQFQRILDDGVAEGLAGVSVYVSWDGGSWSGVGGLTSADSGEGLSSDSPFRLASITKLFTATVILQLVDENVLRLGDSLADLLPTGAAGEIPYAKFITIGNLLDHTSGIRSFSDIDGFWRDAYGERGLDRIWKPDDLIRYGLEKKPYFKPGVQGKKQYSNSNYILLGMIIEKLTGESLATVYHKRIYEPLGMTHTLLEGFDDGMEHVQHSFIVGGKGTKIVAKVRGWNKPNDAGLYDVSGNYKLYNSWAWAAGGISSTTDDLHRFLVGVRDGSLLSEQNQEVLFRNNSAKGSAGVFFGGSGGWDGISSSAYQINEGIRIIVLVNTTGIDVTSDTLRGQLYRVIRPNE